MIKNKLIYILILTISVELFSKNLPQCSNQENFARLIGDAFTKLPVEFQKSGKQITLNMSDCEENVVIRFTTYPLNDDKEDCANYSQVVYISPKNSSVNVVFLSPDKETLKQGRGSVLLEVINESIWPLYVLEEIVDIGILKTKGPHLNKLFKLLGSQLSDETIDLLKFEYKDLKNGQTIFLEKPEKKRASKNWLNEEFQKIEALI